MSRVSSPDGTSRIDGEVESAETEAATTLFRDSFQSAAHKAITVLMALGNLRHPAGVRAAGELLNYPHRNIRAVALAVLARHHPDDAVVLPGDDSLRASNAAT